MNAELLGTGDVAKLLGVNRWKLMYWIERGDLPGPSQSLVGRRLFTPADVEAIQREYRQKWITRADDAVAC